MPCVTCDLPVKPVLSGLDWNHLSGLTLADLDFGRPGRIDLLLGFDIFVETLHGRRTGPTGTPVAFEIVFGWVLAGSTNRLSPETYINASHHSLVATGDDLLRNFWETTRPDSNLAPEKKFVVQNFEENHRRAPDGRFIVPLPRKPHAPLLCESRSHAVSLFLSLERSLRAKGSPRLCDTRIRCPEARGTRTHDGTRCSPKPCVLSPHACSKEEFQHDNDDSSHVRRI